MTIDKKNVICERLLRLNKIYKFSLQQENDHIVGFLRQCLMQ
jgi:ribosomal protein L30/L7E